MSAGSGCAQSRFLKVASELPVVCSELLVILQLNLSKEVFNIFFHSFRTWTVACTLSLHIS